MQDVTFVRLAAQVGAPGSIYGNIDAPAMRLLVPGWARTPIPPPRSSRVTEVRQ
jgi:hypothetical protein